MKLHHRLMSGKHILAIKQRCKKRLSTSNLALAIKATGTVLAGHLQSTKTNVVPSRRKREEGCPYCVVEIFTQCRIKSCDIHG
jgi:hypothetical protein